MYLDLSQKSLKMRIKFYINFVSYKYMDNLLMNLLMNYISIFSLEK